MKQPTFYIPHGGGPCFFMPDPAGIWTGMERFLHSVPTLLPEKPKAILIVSGHWETHGFQFSGNPTPPLIFDYYGFPPHTYELRYDVPGDPALAERAALLLATAGFQSGVDPSRGIDHGVFVPLKVAFPEADVPVVEMSLDSGLDPATAYAVGHALAPLRDEGVLIVGAGMSYHNMRGYGDPRATAPSEAFDTWLTDAVLSDGADRRTALAEWAAAPHGRASHPREEHLLPLMVAAGAGGVGSKVYGEKVMTTMISGFRFD